MSKADALDLEPALKLLQTMKDQQKQSEAKDKKIKEQAAQIEEYLRCSVHLESTRHMYRWPVCEHLFCLPCIWKYAQSPECRGHRRTEEDLEYPLHSALWGHPAPASFENEDMMKFANTVSVIGCPICADSQESEPQHIMDFFLSLKKCYPRLHSFGPQKGDLVKCFHAGCDATFSKNVSTHVIAQHVWSCPFLKIPCARSTPETACWITGKQMPAAKDLQGSDDHARGDDWFYRTMETHAKDCVIPVKCPECHGSFSWSTFSEHRKLDCRSLAQLNKMQLILLEERLPHDETQANFLELRERINSLYTDFGLLLK